MVIPSSNGHPHLWEIGDSKIIPQALVENQSPVSLPRRYTPRKERLGTDFQPRPSGDFAVSDFPEVRISTVSAQRVLSSLSIFQTEIKIP